MTGDAALDLTLYLVTDTAMCRRHGIVRTVRDAVDAGVTVVQLRDPRADDREFVALGHLVRSALRGTDVPLLLNDRVHLVEEIGAQGAHLGQSDTDLGRARAALGPTAYLGLSVSTPEQVRKASRHPEGTIDYLGVGPVWATGTKPDHAQPLGPDGAARVVAASPWPCVVIGGISAERVADVRTCGARGIAVVSAVCAAIDVTTATRTLRAAWEGQP